MPIISSFVVLPVLSASSQPLVQSSSTIVRHYTSAKYLSCSNLDKITYSWATNGNFAFWDSSGNNLTMSQLNAFGVIVGGVTLWSNSSYVAYNFAGTITTHTYNIWIYFKSTPDGCGGYVANLKITLSGSISGITTIPLIIPFNTKTSINQETNGISVGDSNHKLTFSWADSLGFSPVYTSTTKTLQYTIGPTFTIDPSTVISGLASQGIAAWGIDNLDGGQIANSRYWAFFTAGSSYEFSSCPTSSCTWATATIITTSCFISGGGLAIWISGTTVYRLCANAGAPTSFYVDSGTLNSGGTITWGTELNVANNFATGGNTIIENTVLDSNGNWWVVVQSNNAGTPKLEIWECTTTCLTSGNWVFKTSFTVASGTIDPELIALTAGKLALVWSGATAALNIATFSGSAWSSSVATSATDYHLGHGSCAEITDNIICVVGDLTDNIVAEFQGNYNGNSPTWGSENSFGSCTIPWAGVASDGASNLIAYYSCDTGTSTFYRTSNNGGGTFGSQATDASGTETAPAFMDIGRTLNSNNQVEALWTSGSAGSFNLRFSTITIQLPIIQSLSETFSWKEKLAAFLGGSQTQPPIIMITDTFHWSEVPNIFGVIKIFLQEKFHELEQTFVIKVIQKFISEVFTWTEQLCIITYSCQLTQSTFTAFVNTSAVFVLYDSPYDFFVTAIMIPAFVIIAIIYLARQYGGFTDNMILPLFLFIILMIAWGGAGVIFPSWVSLVAILITGGGLSYLFSDWLYGRFRRSE